MVSKFHLQQNIIKQKDGKEKTLGYRLLRSELESEPQPCMCPVQQRYSHSVRESVVADVKVSQLFRGVFKTGNINKENGQTEYTQKNCSSQCVAFQLMEKSKKLTFKCAWAGFIYEIDSIVKNQTNE